MYSLWLSFLLWLRRNDFDRYSYHSFNLEGKHHTGVYDKLILGHCLHLLNQKFCSQQCKICIMQETSPGHFLVLVLMTLDYGITEFPARLIQKELSSFSLRKTEV
ncbi:mCG1035771, isoform CRA_b [Mus musculus]|jgi:hypothetical protein|nr:mCG1035771, isoform CRA_b [Mus musculus]